ncbi:MAG TPA: hypothetical protein V6D47_09745 [Oscillatoriaceae cyanobacterium]
MGTLRRSAAALLVAGLLGGCGHAAFQAALPASPGINLTAASGESGTAHATLVNQGNAWKLIVVGQGLRTSGAYGVFLINLPSGVHQGVGSPPFSLGVTASGTVDFIGTARMHPANSLELVVNYYPSGNPADTAGAQQAFSGTFSAPLR